MLEEWKLMNCSIILFINSWRRFYNVVVYCAAGLEEFEEKIDRITENKGEVGDSDSWIANIYKQFAGEYADVS